MEAVAKSYMRKGFLIYEEMRKYLVIYEEAVSHICICSEGCLRNFEGTAPHSSVLHCTVSHTDKKENFSFFIGALHCTVLSVQLQATLL